MESQVAIMVGGAAGVPGALAASLVDGGKEQRDAPAITQLGLREEETAWG